MEYLKSVKNRLKKIPERNIVYMDLFDRPDLVYGNINSFQERVNFCKIPVEAQNEIKDKWENSLKSLKMFKNASCGNVIRFHTDSQRLIIKAKINREKGYEKTLNWNSMGFDVYNIDDEGNYVHNNLFAPMDKHSVFANAIKVPENGNMCIYLPNFVEIKELLIGYQKGKTIEPLKYPENKLPIIFYGNSVTQGASASRSGNTFPNILSRKLNQEVINLSFASCCKGLESMAEMIGRINCHAIVIDYTRSATSAKMLHQTHEKFYKTIRKNHPDKKIILMTTEGFNDWRLSEIFDKIVTKTYDNAKANGENTEIINQRKLFDKEEYSFVAIDSAHYTDYGMYRVADEIAKKIKE
ncbi:MAG: hypothetical protein BZ138_00700 [Methanosphaera sp. rholeuAM270]|nr:MAG: hypothetical protein BZ138_00700 [Methanosphaera sp. rholeuAM270]